MRGYFQIHGNNSAMAGVRPCLEVRLNVELV